MHRKWDESSEVIADFAMPIRRVQAHEKVEAAQDRVALERGPIVYCVEAADNGDRVPRMVMSQPKLEVAADIESTVRPTYARA